MSIARIENGNLYCTSYVGLEKVYIKDTDIAVNPNLIFGSKPFVFANSSTSGFSMGAGTSTTLAQLDEFEGKNYVLHKYRTGYTSTSWFEAPQYWYRGTAAQNTLVPGNTYTWSFKKWSSSSSDGDSGWFFRCYDSSGTVILSKSATRVDAFQANTWQLYTCTFTMPSAYDKIYFTDTVATNCDFYTCDWKIEEGSIATPWCHENSTVTSWTAPVEAIDFIEK